MQTAESISAGLNAAPYAGPSFRRVDQIEWDDFARLGEHLGHRARPLLIKGAIRQWPATERWTFEKLAELRRRDGSEVLTNFQIGIAEQGQSRQDVIRPIAPYLRSLAQAQRNAFAAGDHLRGLLTAEQHAMISPAETFRLDWSYMKTLPRDQPYISLWHILKEFPELKADFKVQEVWPGLRWDWQYTFLGPGKSVTGFHFDYPTNLFCQVSGVKEFLLFPPDQNEYMAPSTKYDWGGKMSHVDITRLDEQPELAAAFARASGLYARVESGDALFVPRRTWHAVVSSVPSVSLAVFGLTPWQLFIDGLPSVARAGLHAIGLHGRGNCTCHGKTSLDAEIAVPGAQ
jgi:hypothetical protein